MLDNLNIMFEKNKFMLEINNKLLYLTNIKKEGMLK